jgi:hypothetical protein
VTEPSFSETRIFSPPKVAMSALFPANSDAMCLPETTCNFRMAVSFA